MTITERPWLAEVHPYRPGRPARSSDGSLASNESPLGASADVAPAILAAAGRVHRYPDPLADELRAELATQHGVDPEQILVGNGSDELIFLLAWAYLANGGHAVSAEPAYQVDEISTIIAGARLTKVPLLDWHHDLAEMARMPADIAYVVNPHNPTGTVCTRKEIEQFVAQSPARLVVVDEAYVEFADDPDAVTMMPAAGEGRIAVLRTFSKVYGLAGLRVGYLVADREIIATLRKVRAPFSVSVPAQAGALAAARDHKHTADVRAHTLRLREQVARALVDAGLAVIPSQANFVLARTPDEHGFVEWLAAEGIAVRPGSALGVPGTVRISVPSESGLQLLKDALAALPSEHRSI